MQNRAENEGMAQLWNLTSSTRASAAYPAEARLDERIGRWLTGGSGARKPVAFMGATVLDSDPHVDPLR